MAQDKHSTQHEDVVHAAGKDQMAEKLADPAKTLAESGLRLTDGSDRVKSMGFVGGVRQPESQD